MKKYIFAALIMLVQPFNNVKGQVALADSLNMAEREYFYRKYRSIRDTMRINTWLNLKRISDNLDQVVRRDQQVIDALNLRISADSVVISDLNDIEVRFHELQLKYDDLHEQSSKDKAFFLYFKIAIASLTLVLFLFLFILINRVGKLKKIRAELDHSAAGFEESLHQLESLDAEIRKLKQREVDFREELEKGMESNQVRLLSLQQKCETLEKENQHLRKITEAGEGGHFPLSSDIVAKAELPDNPDDLKQMVKSLLDERNSLINLAGKLRTQAETENKKNQEIIGRINLLVNDLSAGNSF